MEVKENYNAFKGNSKLGIKTGVQKPKPLKSSTETKLQLQTIRPEELKGNTNILTPPNHSNTTNCTWLITSNFGSYIILNFKFIEVNSKNSIHKSNFIKFLFC